MISANKLTLMCTLACAMPVAVLAEEDNAPSLQSNVQVQVHPPPSPLPPPPAREPSWSEQAGYFVGLRSGVGFAPGGKGPSATGGLEMGLVAPKGIGLGLHVLGVGNAPGVPAFDVPPTDYAMGAAVDLRWYLQTIDSLSLYPTLALGFLTGPDRETGENVVMPMLNPGFGARLGLGDFYLSCELGAAAAHIPFVNMALGWSPPRHADSE